MDPIVRFGVTSAHRLIENAQREIVGIYVAAPTPRDVGEHVALKLELPFDRPFIRTVRGVGYGVGLA